MTNLRLIHSQTEEKRRARWTTLAFMPKKKTDPLSDLETPFVIPEKAKAPPEGEAPANPPVVEAGED